MDWDAIGAVGEVVGAAGVIVTLAFLTHQLRQNTKALRADSFRAVFEVGHNSTSMIIQDPEIAELHVRGRADWSSLTPIEQQRFHYLMCQRLHSIQSMIFYDQANDGRSIFGEMADNQIARSALDPGLVDWWEQRGQHVFDDEFRKYVRSIIDSVARD